MAVASQTTTVSCSVIICPSHDLYTKVSTDQQTGKKIQEKERKSELLSIWLQHRVSLVSSINIIASALSMRDVLHCLIPKSSVCILTTCSLIETAIEEEIVSYCYLWIFGYIAAIHFRSPSSLTAARLNVGLMWCVMNHNLRGGQETFQLFYSLH